MQMVWSVVASFCGIQTDRNLDRDDAYIDKTGFTPYIVIGVILTILFVLLIYAVVQLVLHFATA